MINTSRPWTCTCGHVNRSKFCVECGKPAPHIMPRPMPDMVPIQAESFEPIVEDTEKTLLFDFYKNTTSAVGTEYHEITINRGDDDQLYINIYQGSGGSESHSAYRATEEALSEVMAIVEKYDLEKYIGTMYPTITGGNRVVKFYAKDGRFLRIRLENVPVEVSGVFYEIEKMLNSHIDRTKRVK